MPRPKPTRKEARTPLGREYLRLISSSTEDPRLYTFEGRRTFYAEELKIWSASVGKVKNPALTIGPPSIRPNPFVFGDLVVCATFSPCRMIAFDRVTGARRWSDRFGLCGDSVNSGQRGLGLMYCRTGQGLLALRADSGQIEWRFRPHGRKGIMSYSCPVVADDRLLIGDHHGYLHCLAAATGEPVWQVLTSRATNNPVNSDPVVGGNVAVVGTNAGLALGYDLATGREVWRARLDGPCIYTIAAGHGNTLLWTSTSAYLYSIRNGTCRGHWNKRNHRIESACVAGDLTLLVTCRVWGKKRLRWPVTELRAYRGNTEVYTRTYPRWSGTMVRYEPMTCRVYEASMYGLGILDPRTGKREAVIHFAGVPDRPCGDVRLPSVVDGRLYVFSDTGQVFALKHP